MQQQRQDSFVVLPDQPRTSGSVLTNDIDVVNGSRLLINGRDVEKSIDNVGALSAALGSVPTVSADSQFTCGFGEVPIVVHMPLAEVAHQESLTVFRSMQHWPR